jgi:hypothetical protein
MTGDLVSRLSSDLTSSDLELCHDGANQQIAGIVFPSVNMPSSYRSTLVNTHLVFEIDEIRGVSTQDVTVRIFGESSVSAAQPGSSAGDFSRRTRSEHARLQPETTPAGCQRVPCCPAATLPC